MLAALLLLQVAEAAKKPVWAPSGDNIRTRWAAEVSPQNVLPEYPRPQMFRPDWLNLNGLWNYAIAPLSETPEVKGKFAPDGQILVPFAPESSLSGVGRFVGRENHLWYERTFTLPKGWAGKKVLLHFGAVDWKAEVWVNGSKVGEHTGGYTPFHFDITDKLKKKGSQTIRVKVFDATDQAWQPRGKQIAFPQGIWYTPVTGIWQTVWLEAVPETHIESYYAVSDIDAGTVKVTSDVEGIQEGDIVKVRLLEGSQGYNAEKPSSAVIAEAAGREVTLKVPSMKTWSPDSPYLYGLEIVIERDGKSIDRISGYTAMRKVSEISVIPHPMFKRGYKRIALNNEPLFQFGPLDQGWWPDGLYTAPTDEALRFDIEKTKAWGYNMIRKHIKVEPARWYYWCDVLGILVWQDMPCIADHNRKANQNRDKDLARAQMNKWPNDSFIGGTDCDVPEKWKQNYYKEWAEIIACLKGFPCIAVWVPFNEGWGQFDTEKVVEFTRKEDGTRLINEASGGNFHLSGDILDIHHYPEPTLSAFERKRINVVGEYGGIGYAIKGHLWKDDGKNWGYNGLCQTPEEVLERYDVFAKRLQTLIGTGCAAAVYTQTTDVEVEVNGLMTYDRLVKIDEAKLREINRRVIATSIYVE